MRKKSILLTAMSLFVALLASAFVFAGCGGETNPPDGGDSSTGGGSVSGGTDIQNTLTLTRTSVQLVYGETAVVVAKYKDEDGKTLVWQTSDSSVATVDGGVITSVGLGSAVVTATYGSLSATCAVSVSYGAYQPTLKVDHIGDELSLLKNEDYEVNAHVLFNGKDYPCELTAVIDDSTVATFENGKIKALKSGTTNVTIKGVWKGFESPLMEKIISLNVVESDVVMYLNVEKDGEKEVRDEVTLYVTDSFEGNSYTTSAKVELVATENGVSKDGTLSVVNGSNYVMLEEDGVVTAKGVGSATVRATYVSGETTYTKDLIVNVICPVVPYTKQFILTDEVIGSGSYKDYFDEGATLVSVKQGTREIKTFGKTWSGIVYNGAQTEAVEIQTSKGGYLFENVYGCNVLLTTENFASTLTLGSKDVTQYYGLIGDIGTPENPVSMNGQRNASDSSAFKGTFDGNGKTVYANVYENGIFGGYGAGAVVKNAKFVLTFNGTKANGLSSDKSRWGKNLNITLENLYIETTNFRKGDHAISEFKAERLKMKDIVVVINNATGLTDYDGSDDAGVLFGVDVCYFTYNQGNVGLELFDNVRVVVDKLLPMASGKYYSNTKFVNFAVNDISAFGNVTRKSNYEENADYCLITAVENHSDWLTDVCYGGNGKVDQYIKGIYFCYGATRLENGGVYRYNTFKAMTEAGVKQVGTWKIV